MAQTNQNTPDLEEKIIKTARKVFLEKGFKETNMSDIAAELGINRPTLYYYYRTKEKLFNAVYGEIINSFLPKIAGILQEDVPLKDRIELMVDTYLDNFINNPDLPHFFIKESQRDPKSIITCIYNLHLEKYLNDIISAIDKEKAKGTVNDVPLFAIFFTMFGLVSGPFLTRRITESLFMKDENDNSEWRVSDNFKELIKSWKPYIIMNMENLLLKKDN